MKCKRTACDNENAVCRHTQTGFFYCPRCARKINEMWPNLVVFPQDNPMLQKLVAELQEIADVQLDEIAVQGKISKGAWQELVRLTSAMQPVESPPDWVLNGPKEPVYVWAFSNAPADLQKVGTKGGDEDWLVLTLATGDNEQYTDFQAIVRMLASVDGYEEKELMTINFKGQRHLLYVTQH